CLCVWVWREPPIAMTSSHPGILSLDTLVRGHSCHQSVAANTHTTTSWLSILPHRQASTFNSLLRSPPPRPLPPISSLCADCALVFPQGLAHLMMADQGM